MLQIRKLLEIYIYMYMTKLSNQTLIAWLDVVLTCLNFKMICGRYVMRKKYVCLYMKITHSFAVPASFSF
jgi:hypothetical protein